MGYFVAQDSGGSNEEGPQAVWTRNISSAGIDNADPSDPPINARQFAWVPYNTTLKTFSNRVSVPCGVGRTTHFRVHKDSNGSIGATQTITGAVSTEVSNTIEEEFPGLDVTDDTSIRDTIHYTTIWPVLTGNAPGTGYHAYEYLDGAHPGVVWFLCNVGADIPSASFTAVDAFAHVGDSLISSANTTQGVKQLIVPRAGQIRYIWYVWRGWTSTTTVEIALQQGTFPGGGVDTAAVYSMVGAATTTPYQAVLDTTTTIAVAAGDYLNWRFVRTAGAATVGSFAMGFGFAVGV